MGSRDPRVDAYLAQIDPSFAAVLTVLRDLAHECVPDLTEDIKWGKASLEYKGPFMGLASFKQHCRSMFWLSTAMKEQGDARLNTIIETLEGHLRTLEDLPSEADLRYLFSKAIEAKDAGAKMERGTVPKPELPTPPDLAAALAEHDIAEANWAKFTVAMRRDYIEWVLEAKTDSTRAKRVATTTEWVGEGKKRNWKYEKC